METEMKILFVVLAMLFATQAVSARVVHVPNFQDHWNIGY
jgi:hypothetical protein